MPEGPELQEMLPRPVWTSETECLMFLLEFVETAYSEGAGVPLVVFFFPFRGWQPKH